VKKCVALVLVCIVLASSSSLLQMSQAASIQPTTDSLAPWLLLSIIIGVSVRIVWIKRKPAYYWDYDSSPRRNPKGTVVRTGGIGATTLALPCMICNLEMKETDEVAWCPYCGNIGHKVHLLEWLHTHNSCPMCQTHLNEKILREQLHMQ